MNPATSLHGLHLQKIHSVLSTGRQQLPVVLKSLVGGLKGCAAAEGGEGVQENGESRQSSGTALRMSRGWRVSGTRVGAERGELSRSEAEQMCRVETAVSRERLGGGWGFGVRGGGVFLPEQYWVSPQPGNISISARGSPSALGTRLGTLQAQQRGGDQDRCGLKNEHHARGFLLWF